ncbi:cytosine permease [Citricoccus alkalitolerans]|uniref:Purine-cytosine permease family protein n=1 Tax=Citricoccus alkalitolerans TaxID=246603 RepID=A0ABV8XSD3_9MICC
MSTKSPELRFVEFIPHSERHGRPASQFPLWFSVNMMVLTTLTGGIGVLAGLNMFWSLVAIVCGNFLGALFVAGHSVQGPKLGIPQMIQSRAQFGFYGAAIPLLAVLVMYIGYFASNSVIAGDAIQSGTPIDKNWGILLSGLVILVITYYGHDVIHKVERWFAVILGLGFLVLTVAVLQYGIPGESWNPGDFNVNAFLLLVAATATWQLTFAPYVADYSRYLPVNTSGRQTFFFTYSGLVVSTTWLMTLGAMLTTAFPDFGDRPSETIAALFPDALSPAVYIFIVLGVIATNVFNLYGAFMSLTTIVDTFKRVKTSLSARAVLFLIVFVVATLVAVLASSNFMSFFGNLLIVLGYMLFPWTTINLVDFFFIRKGRYVVADIFAPNGRYGRFNARALAAYLVTILVEIPFMSTAFFTGFMFEAVGGIDYAWIIALILPGIIYFVLMRDTRRMADELETDTISPDDESHDELTTPVGAV